MLEFIFLKARKYLGHEVQEWTARRYLRYQILEKIINVLIPRPQGNPPQQKDKVKK